MAIVIRKKSREDVAVKPRVATRANATNRSKYADEIDAVGKLYPDAVRLTADIKSLSEKLKPYKVALEALQAKLDEDMRGDDETFVENGTEYGVQVGVKGTSREITDLPGIRKKVGDDLFMQLASIPLGKLDEILSPLEQEKFVTKNRTKRKIDLVKLS